jgi:hypothetical protein
MDDVGRHFGDLDGRQPRASHVCAGLAMLSSFKRSCPIAICNCFLPPSVRVTCRGSSYTSPTAPRTFFRTESSNTTTHLAHLHLPSTLLTLHNPRCTVCLSPPSLPAHYPPTRFPQRIAGTGRLRSNHSAARKTILRHLATSGFRGPI